LIRQRIKRCVGAHDLGQEFVKLGGPDEGSRGGVHYECHEGYGQIDLYADGTWAHRYVPYGWQAASETPNA
jgi:hypothetical protein